MTRILGYAVLIMMFCWEPASSQFYYFGRNKVQYTQFEWQILKTEHFDIYFYPEMRDLAERGAYFAETAFKELEQKFNHTVANRIPLILYSSHLHFQQTNVTPGFISEGVGGFFEFLKGRVVIPSNGSTYQFNHVIRHELVHVFTMSKINRVLLDHQLAQDRLPPLWFTEGLAEYWSTQWDTQAEMVLRDAVLNNYIVPLDNMEQIYGSFLMYKEGQQICEFIAQRYGEEKILLLFENFWKATAFSEVMKLTIGKNFKEFDEDWIYALKKRYYPLMAENDLPSGVTHNIVDEGFNSKPVYFAHDGKREVYFIGNRTGYTNIYRVNLDEKDPTPEVVVEGETSNEFEAFHLFQSKLAISKNGILAFVTKSGENDVLHLYDVVHDELMETIRFQNQVVLASPSWSPDGKKLVFSSIDKSGNNDLHIFEVESRSLIKLTDDFYDDRDPAWSPDGKQIAFGSDRTSTGERGSYNLFLYNLETHSIEYLTYGKESYHAPSWSHNGKWLAFTSDLDGAENIWLMSILDSAKDGGRSMRKLTTLSTAAFDPTWGGNDEIIFSSFENFSFQLKSVKDIEHTYAVSTSIRPFSPEQSGLRWVEKKLGGESVVGQFRYEGDYQLDIAQSQISVDPIFGTAGGAALAISDVLGNEMYYFLIYNTAQSTSELLESFNIAMSRISLGQRTNYAYGIFHFSGYRHDLTDPDLFYWERSFGGYFALSYPISKFRRIEANVTMSNSDKDVLTGNLPRRALLVSNAMSFVWDNSLWGPTGPLDGNRLKLTLAFTSDIQYSNVSYYTVIADYRSYLRLGTRSAVASRFNLWWNEGKEARRFFMGGSWDLRGWMRWSIRGQKIWITSHELRFPFIDQLGIRFPFGGLALGSIRGALFADFGGAWDKKYIDTKGSIGAGIRLNFGGIVVLRYDIGKRIENNLANLQEGLFYQFFFGWDF